MTARDWSKFRGSDNVCIQDNEKNVSYDVYYPGKNGCDELVIKSGESQYVFQHPSQIKLFFDNKKRMDDIEKICTKCKL